jgi:hypothetical protein
LVPCPAPEQEAGLRNKKNHISTRIPLIEDGKRAKRFFIFFPELFFLFYNDYILYLCMFELLVDKSAFYALLDKQLKILQNLGRLL